MTTFILDIPLAASSDWALLSFCGNNASRQTLPLKGTAILKCDA